jgi:hypothetical protein
MNIASYLRRNYQCEVKIEDIRLKGNEHFDLEAAIRTYAPDIVGISALSHETEAVPWIAECVKRVPSSWASPSKPHRRVCKS